MRIIHLIDSLDPASGGPPAVAIRLAAAQAAMGHEVSVVGYNGKGSEAHLRKTIESIPFIERMMLDVLPSASRLERLTGLGIAEKLSQRVAHSDIVQLHGVWEQLLLVGARLARRAAIPYVVTPHGMLDRWSMAQRRVKKRLALAMGYRRMLDHARYLHVLNVHESEAIEDLGILASREIIPNGIFLEENPAETLENRFRSKHPALVRNPYILFLGRLHFKKGLDYLADAFRFVAVRNETVQLIVIGPDGGERESFLRRVQEFGLSDRVHLMDAVYGAEKYRALQDASCFCLPSRQEGFSLAILEAMSCGTPVVISEACHFPDVEEADAGCVVPLIPESIADALLAVISDEDQRERMGRHGKALVREKYTWTAIAQQSVELYERYVT